jgi:hypothetical protein
MTQCVFTKFSTMFISVFIELFTISYHTRSRYVPSHRYEYSPHHPVVTNPLPQANDHMSSI